MVEYINDGFESGDTSGWAGVTSTTGDTTGVGGLASGIVVHTGSYAFRGETDGSTATENAYVYMSGDFAALYARCYVYIPSNIPVIATGDLIDFIRFRAGTTLLAHNGIRYSSGAKFWIQNRDGTSYVDNYSNPSTLMEADTWYCIEAYWENSATGASKLWINGNLVVDVVSDTNNYGNCSRVAFGIAETGGTISATVYVDDCVVSDSYIGLLPDSVVAKKYRDHWFYIMGKRIITRSKVG